MRVEQKRKERLIKAVSVYISFTFLLLTWELLVYVLDISQIVLIKPSEIYPVIFESKDIILPEIRFTFHEIFWGWFWGNLSGFIIASLIYSYRSINDLFSSASVLINAMPIITLVAIISNFMGTGQDSKILITAILCFFPMLITSIVSLSSRPLSERDLLRSFSSGRIKKYWHLDLPGALPAIMKTLEINVVTAIFAAVVSEFFGAHGGIGSLILANKGLYNLPLVWASIFYIILIGILFYVMVNLLGKFATPWDKDNIN